MNVVETTSTAQLFAAINTQPMGFIPLPWPNEIGVTAGVIVGGFANPRRTQSPAIGAALGAASNATGTAYPAALKQLNDALVNNAWVIPVAEQYAYAGYNAKKVTKPVFPGQDEYPLLTSIGGPPPDVPGYLARRIAFAVSTVLAASVVSFLLVHASGSSPGAITAGAGATPALVAAENLRLGWDQPLVTQYATWLGHAASGNLGASLIDGHDIWSDLMNRLPVTASIAVFATLLSGIFGVVIGVAAAVRGGRADRVVSLGSGVVLSLPQFWVGILLVYLVAIKAGLLPATGYVPFSTSPEQYLQSLALPVITLAITGTAIIARTTRTGMISALRQEHIRTLHALGTPPWRIRYIHALRLMPAAPVVSVLGIQFIALFGGSVVIEQLFALPGLGQAAQNGIGASDFPAVQGVVVIATVVVVITNLVLDVVLAALDPKVRTA